MDTTRDLTKLERYHAVQVTAIASRTFGSRVEQTLLSTLAARAVAGLVRDGMRLTDFVPGLALRAVREAVESRSIDSRLQATAA